MTIHTISDDNSIMSFLSQFPELRAKGNNSSVSLFSPKSPKTILIMPKPKLTDDEKSKKEQLLQDLDYKEQLAQKRKEQAAIKQAQLKAAEEELKQAEQEFQDAADAAARLREEAGLTENEDPFNVTQSDIENESSDDEPSDDDDQLEGTKKRPIMLPEDVSKDAPTLAGKGGPGKQQTASKLPPPKRAKLSPAADAANPAVPVDAAAATVRAANAAAAAATVRAANAAAAAANARAANAAAAAANARAANAVPPPGFGTPPDARCALAASYRDHTKLSQPQLKELFDDYKTFILSMPAFMLSVRQGITPGT
jgi:hypothetical protein